MPWRPRTRPSSSSARGYDAQHERLTAAAIAAEPWCHTLPVCPWPDAGTPSNPLQGDHPLSLAECGGDWDRWRGQRRVPLCRRCNLAKEAASRWT